MQSCSQVVHDFEHGGLTNDFLVNSLDLLAVRYNDRSPLENHHLAAAFTLMRKPEYDFVCNVPKAEFDRLRKVCAGPAGFCGFGVFWGGGVGGQHSCQGCVRRTAIASVVPLPRLLTVGLGREGACLTACALRVVNMCVVCLHVCAGGD